ncbi:MAG: dTMP kinase [Pseudomonadota bacterium]
MRPGRFIAFEGGEGAGKSTQARLLVDALNARGTPAIMTREPGGTTGAEAVRELLLAVEGEGWFPRAEALLFAAARSDHVERLIRPTLAAGTWVVCDRFIDSTRAYQGQGAGLADEDLLALHHFGSGGLLPDLTVLIEVSIDVATARVDRRDPAGKDRIGGRPAEFHARVAAAFDRIAANEPGRFARIDGSGPTGDTHTAVLGAVARLG